MSRLCSLRSRRMSDFSETSTARRGHMRTLMSGRGRTWLARAGELWTALNGRVASHFDSTASDQHRRLTAHAFAASVVAGAFLLQWTLGRAAGEPQFWLFHVAIVLTAAYGGAAATLVATLLSVLLARLSSAVPMSTALLFGVEGLLIGLVVLRMTKVIQDVAAESGGFGSRARISRASSVPAWTVR